MLTFSSPAARRVWEAGQRFARPEPQRLPPPPPTPQRLGPPLGEIIRDGIAVAAARIVYEAQAPTPPDRSARPLSTRDIQDAACRHFALPRTEYLSQRRNRSVVRARQVGMYLAKTLTMASLPEIGRRFGGRDHTTILHGVRKIEALIAADDPIAADVEKLLAELRGG